MKRIFIIIIIILIVAILGTIPNKQSKPDIVETIQYGYSLELGNTDIWYYAEIEYTIYDDNSISAKIISD